MRGKAREAARADVGALLSEAAMQQHPLGNQADMSTSHTIAAWNQFTMVMGASQDSGAKHGKLPEQM